MWLWAAGAVVGLLVAIAASKRAVRYASALALGFGVSPFLVGVTLMSIGTDLPEMANSIMASVSGHGDINLGDSIGSAVTQLTLVLGILPFVVGAFPVGRRRVLVVGGLAAAVLALAGVLASDGFLSRTDGLLLVSAWIVATVVLVIWRPVAAEAALVVPASRSVVLVFQALGSLALVGAGAALTVSATIRLAEAVGAPEFLVSFFGLALGTSLPELVVDLTALRAGQRDMAIGDAFGSSLVDGSLALGIGPVVAPTLVTARYGAVAALGAAPIVLLVALVLAYRRRHTRWSGALLLLLYASFFPLLLAL